MLQESVSESTASERSFLISFWMWEFLLSLLHLYSPHPRTESWTKSCITSDGCKGHSRSSCILVWFLGFQWQGDLVFWKSFSVSSGEHFFLPFFLGMLQVAAPLSEMDLRWIWPIHFGNLEGAQLKQNFCASHHSFLIAILSTSRWALVFLLVHSLWLSCFDTGLLRAHIIHGFMNISSV